MTEPACRLNPTSRRQHEVSRAAGWRESTTTEMCTLPDVRSTSSATPPGLGRTVKSALALPSVTLRSVISPAIGGTNGLLSRTSPCSGRNSRPSIDCKSENGAAAAQACGEQATGYSVGPRLRRARKPQNSSGKRC